MSSSKISILIIDDLHPCFFEQDFAGFDISYMPDIEPEQVKIELIHHHVLIVRSKVVVDKNLCEFATHLKLVARAGSGLDNLDTQWLSDNHIAYLNTPEANGLAVAEQTLGMLLSLMSNIVKSHQEVKNLIWDREGNRGDELSGKTIGIIGYGHTGSQFAKLLNGFDVNILVYDKYKSGFGTDRIIESEMPAIFHQADILSLHIPLTKETQNLINDDYIAQFKKPIRLLNLSRGAIVNLNTIIEELKSHKIIGFATDVLPNEKMNQLSKSELLILNELKACDNVIITPHIGGWTIQSYKKIALSLALKIKAFFQKNTDLLFGFQELKIKDLTNI
jgi:D-3-phosphoglycerate dehydrogenase